MKLILASQSPRRKKLLKEIGLKFIIHPSNFAEHTAHVSPEKLALKNAEGKAKDVAKNHKKGLVLGVDTIVVCKNQILGKPKNKKDALRILNLLSGTTHKVISGLCLIDAKTKKKILGAETTAVTIDHLTKKERLAYVASKEGEDKAAGYAIQGIGSLFIKKINGDYFNVVGLPIFKLKKMLKKFDVENWF